MMMMKPYQSLLSWVYVLDVGLAEKVSSLKKCATWPWGHHDPSNREVPNLWSCSKQTGMVVDRDDTIATFMNQLIHLIERFLIYGLARNRQGWTDGG
jgi:hypothetical protein